MESFKVRVKELRKEKRFTQREMGEQLGITMRAYQCYEQGTRYPEFPGLIKLADFFDVSLDYLVGRSNHREREP
jgi:transcriptional regulator with XRE-family HTH domain